MATRTISERPQVDREHALFLLREMLRIRRFEEKAAEMYSLQRIHGFLHLYIGEEATGVGAMQAFTPEDAIVATYREHGHALSRGMPAKVLMAEMFGKAGDAATATVVRCTSLMRAAASMAGTPSSEAGCPSRWAWPWPTSCKIDKE